MSPVVALLIAVALLAANGFFVAAEFALLTARRARIEHLAAGGHRRARFALAGLRELSLMLAGAQLGVTICSLGLGAIAEPALAHLIEGGLGLVQIPDAVGNALGFATGLTIVVFLHMVVGEMAPKSWAISNPEASVLALAPPFRAFALLFRPVISVLNALANATVRLCGVEPQDERTMAHSRADLLLLLEESAGHGTIGPEDHTLLARSLELSGLDAGAAMTPRPDIVAVAADQAVDDVARIARSSGRTRLLVHEGDLDHILGVLHAKDLLLLDARQRAAATARDLTHPALVTHQRRPLEDLLLDMRSAHQHLAVVLDDRNVVAGLVTLEDVLEELIGDFEDESDLPQAGRNGQRSRE
jgi:CBS domain containing-hemolysin-like protein